MKKQTHWCGRCSHGGLDCYRVVDWSSNHRASFTNTVSYVAQYLSGTLKDHSKVVSTQKNRMPIIDYVQLALTGLSQNTTICCQSRESTKAGGKAQGDVLGYWHQCSKLECWFESVKLSLRVNGTDFAKHLTQTLLRRWQVAFCKRSFRIRLSTPSKGNCAETSLSSSSWNSIPL